ncbi:MAG: hypothetical protein NC307_09925 [Roseburia sp.]|nr:hypothetical protein [Roseburia sp.]
MSVLGIGKNGYENYGFSDVHRRGQKPGSKGDLKGFQAKRPDEAKRKEISPEEAQKKGEDREDEEKPTQETGNVPKTYMVYMGDEDTLYSGGNGTGLSFYIKWAEDTTEEDPIMVAKGVDENGDEFEKRIRINDINPTNATLVEMRALEAYAGVDKNGGLSSLPMGTGEMGLHDRRNFMQMFKKEISDMTLLKQRAAVAYYEYSMRNYWDFLDGKKG